MDGTLAKIVDTLTKANAALVGTTSPTDPKPSQLLNEYIGLLKTLEEECESVRNVQLPVQVLQSIDDQVHPDTLLLNRLKEWRAREQQYELKLCTLKSLADRL